MLSEIQSGQWDRWKLYHLFNRAGFGLIPQEWGVWSKLSPQAAVDRLINWENDPEPEQTSPPQCATPDEELSAQLRELRQLPEVERQEKARMLQRQLRQQAQELQQWWFSRMRLSTRPLQEKLALFWHGYFATSLQKVKNPHFMWRQLQIFRTMGHSDFRSILVAVSRDPAMLIWLDGARSRSEAPNENYARELMELFTLGEGNYTEKDVQEAARAFTGWTIDRKSMEVRFVARIHDDGTKSFMGKTGAFTDEDIIDIILSRPECARFLARKLWRFFASGSPSDAIVNALADELRTHRYQIKPVLRRLFLSQEFYCPACMGNQIKSPVEFVVGINRTLEIRKPRDRMNLLVCRQLGQELLHPPSVKGWDGGKAWINNATLELRHEYSRCVVLGGDATLFLPRPEFTEQKADDNPNRIMQAATKRIKNRMKNLPPQIDGEQLLTQLTGQTREQIVDALAERLLMRPLTEPLRKKFLDTLGAKDDPVTEEQLSQCILSMMTDLHYQLV